MTARQLSVPAGEGLAVPVDAGDLVEIINLHGTQVADFWCLSRGDAGEWLSMSHCREVLQKIHFTPGDRLISNRYRALLTVVFDDSGIRHDTLIAACSPEMYRHHGIADHRSCTANFAEALATIGVGFAGDPPQPWNLFMVAPVGVEGAITFARPPLVPGGRVRLKVLADVVLVVSSCPDDVYPTNGGDGAPREIGITVMSGF